MFSKNKCNCCSKRKLCINSKSGRSITINNYEKKLKKLREKQLTAEFKKDYIQRSNGERTIYFLTSKSGRKARYVGVKKVQEQQYLGWSMPKTYSY